MSENKKKPLSSDLYTEEYFLTACEGFDIFIEFEGEHLSRRLNDAFEVANVLPGMKLLDVGCGRGEIITHCMRLGVEAYGIDYAEAAISMTNKIIDDEITRLKAESPDAPSPKTGICRSDAKKLPFPDKYFDRALMFDVVEHLHPWELHEAMLEVRRVLKDDGRFIIHTAPNKWYDDHAYPWVRRFRALLGQREGYPKDPRAITPVNQHVHVNEQDMFSMGRTLKKAGFSSNVWLDSPPQDRQENAVMRLLHKIAFDLPPIRWFFEREVFAVAEKE